MRNIFLALAASASLAACASGSGTALQAISPDVARSSRVAEVTVGRTPGGVSPYFSGILKTKLEQKVAGCALGSRPIRLEAEVIGFKEANPAMTWLLADANSITRSVKLVDVASGEVLGSYAIRRSFTASGLIGVAMMSQAEEQMSEAFGEEVCKSVFNSKSK